MQAPLTAREAQGIFRCVLGLPGSVAQGGLGASVRKRVAGLEGERLRDDIDGSIGLQRASFLFSAGTGEWLYHSVW